MFSEAKNILKGEFWQKTRISTYKNTYLYVELLALAFKTQSVIYHAKTTCAKNPFYGSVIDDVL